MIMLKNNEKHGLNLINYVSFTGLNSHETSSVTPEKRYQLLEQPWITALIRDQEGQTEPENNLSPHNKNESITST